MWEAREPQLVSLLRWRSETTPDDIAYRFFSGTGPAEDLTYRNLADRVRVRACSLLRNHESPQGSASALLLYPPSLDFVISIFACIVAGVPAVPAYPPNPWRPEVGLARLMRLVEDARPASLLADPRLASLLDNIGPFEPRPALVKDEDAEERGSANWPHSRKSVSTDDVALLQYTSGSTRAPRGVVVRHSNLEHNMSAIANYFGLTADSRGFSWLPPYHDMGLIGGVLTPLYVGFPIGLMSPLDFLRSPLSWLQRISEDRVTVSGGPNFAYDLCVSRYNAEDRLTDLDLSSWSVAFNGGDTVRWQTLEAFASKFGRVGFRRSAIFPCYGLAEATLIASGTHWDGTVLHGAQRHREGGLTGSSERPARVSCGRGLADQVLAIVDPASGQRRQPAAEGEIWIRGPSVTTGYWRAGIESEDSFGTLDNFGYLRTGDCGYKVGDELVITGRLKDVIVRRGANHHAVDLEDAAVIGAEGLRPIAAAFTIEQEVGAAVVVVVEEWSEGRQPAGVAAAVRKRVLAATGLAPEIVAIAPAGTIPRTSSGKVQRSRCRDRFCAGELDAYIDRRPAMVVSECRRSHGTRDTLEAMVGLVRGVFAATCGVEECGPHDSLFDLGGDSLRAGEIADVLETGLMVSVTTELVLAASTPTELATRLLDACALESAERQPLHERLIELGNRLETRANQQG